VDGRKWMKRKLKEELKDKMQQKMKPGILYIMNVPK
jgi:hypothetical protein